MYNLFYKIDFGDSKCLDELEEDEKVTDNPGHPDSVGLKEIQYEPDHMERRGTFVGTINYLAPEMI